MKGGTHHLELGGQKGSIVGINWVYLMSSRARFGCGLWPEVAGLVQKVMMCLLTGPVTGKVRTDPRYKYVSPMDRGTGKLQTATTDPFIKEWRPHTTNLTLQPPGRSMKRLRSCDYLWCLRSADRACFRAIAKKGWKSYVAPAPS